MDKIEKMEKLEQIEKIGEIEKIEIKEVKEKSDIVDGISEHVVLKRKGKEFVGICPFHDDTKPSMKITTFRGGILLRTFNKKCNPKKQKIRNQTN